MREIAEALGKTLSECGLQVDVKRAQRDPEQLERWTKPSRVQQIAASIGVREHVVFGGMVADDAGFVRNRLT